MIDLDFCGLQKLVLERSGVALPDGKEYLAEARLVPLIRAEGIGSLQELFDLLRQSPCGAIAEKVVDAMLTKETSFFRDLHLFDALRQNVLPSLIESRSSEQRLHLWSAACASGQEPYSIAMLLREHFPELRHWQLEFVASDISAPTLERARAGSYTQFEVNRGLSAALLPKYFVQAESAWLVREEIRDMVQFRRINLIETWTGLPQMDLIFLRNVLIYFDEATREQILRRVYELLRPDGYLFLGSSETPLLTDDRYVVGSQPGVYRTAGAAGTGP